MENQIVNMSLQVIPLDCGERTYSIIDQAIHIIQNSGIHFRVGPFETAMEGDYDQLMDIIKEAQRICFKHGAGSVVSHLKIEWHRDRAASINDKIKKYYDGEPKNGMTE